MKFQYLSFCLVLEVLHALFLSRVIKGTNGETNHATEETRLLFKFFP
jgi:hypothetical protein